VGSILKTFFALVLFVLSAGAAGAVPCSPGEVLYSDECEALCLQNMTRESSQGVDRGTALKLAPDPWHSPTYKLFCGKNPRRDFTPYSVLEFYFRSPSQNPGNPTIQLRTYNHSSRIAKIRDYISEGAIDNTFRLVRIPLSDLVTGQWDLGNVETLVWNVDPERRIYYVDKITLRQTTLPALITEGKWSPFPESDTILRLTFNRRWQEDTVRQLQNYSLSSTSDNAYAKPVHPSDIGLHSRVEGFSPSKVAATRFSVFLRFPEPLKSSNSYTLHVKGINDEFCNSMTPTEVVFRYDDTTLPNANTKVNQEGYLLDGHKIGYVGGYLGDLGGGVWAVGDNGTVFCWNKRDGWKQAELQVSSTLRSVSGFREDDIYCVGDGGVIVHWNGHRWSRIDSLTNQDLLAVHFGSRGIGWAVGTGGTTLRHEDGKWSLVPTPSKTTLRGVWAGPGDSAWAVGDCGTILKWDGKHWLPEPSTVDSELQAIQGDNENQVWAVGKHGTIIFRKSGIWRRFPAVPNLFAALRSVCTSPGGEVWVGGDNGLLWYKSGPGDSAFEPQNSSTASPIVGLARQNARRLLAVGTAGTLLSCSDHSVGWTREPTLGSKALRGIFALPYGALRLPHPPPAVSIQEASTGKTVLTVPLRLEAANWHLSGEDVHSFDFSALETPGTYRAYVPHLGLSDPFKIGLDVLDRAAYTTAHAFYYQRCGTALTEPYADKRFVRPLDHEYDPKGRKIDAAFHESLPKTPLYGGEMPGTMTDGHGGWHDAGDFGKYVPTAAAALWYLFTAYDIAPEKFADGIWNIPESGNGIPDLLDEARWEVDWLVRMQGRDGAVYHKLTSQKWFEDMPQNESAPRFLFEKTTHDTALGAAVFACAARLWKPYDEAAAAQYLDRAEKAWVFLEEHPETMPKGGFRNPPGNATGEYRDAEDVDNRLWAAAELYRTTGQPKYGEYFEAWWKKNTHHPLGWNDWQHFYRCAYWAYLKSSWPDGNARIKKEIQEDLIRSAEEIVERTHRNPYRNGARLDVPEWIGWGVFTQSSKYAFPLLQTWSLIKDDRHLKAALLNLDAQLGANPLSLCFITGLGKRSPQDPLHHPSLHDKVRDPIPGLPIFGVAAHLPNNQPHYVMSQKDENSFPPGRETLDPYPILRRYIDAHELVPMSEFTIVDMAMTTAVLHLLVPDH
jgi:photosystem II stability/assembly factor-like uncharacterized protein